MVTCTPPVLSNLLSNCTNLQFFFTSIPNVYIKTDSVPTPSLPAEIVEPLDEVCLRAGAKNKHQSGEEARVATSLQLHRLEQTAELMVS